MSILKNRPETTSSTTTETKTKTLEELNKLLETVGEADKQLRAIIRQHRRLEDRLYDLYEAGVSSRALHRTSDELDDIDPTDLKGRLNALRGEIEDATDAPGNIDAVKINGFRRRVTGLQADLSDAEDTIQSAEDTIQAAENKAAADQPKPAAPAESEFTVNTADPSGQMSAKMIALQLFPEYKAAGCPPLKTADGKSVSFAIGVPRGDGTTRFIITDPAVTRPEDMPDLVAGYVQKRAFTPYEGVDGLVAKELMLLAHTKKPW